MNPCVLPDGTVLGERAGSPLKAKLAEQRINLSADLRAARDARHLTNDIGMSSTLAVGISALSPCPRVSGRCGFGATLSMGLGATSLMWSTSWAYASRAYRKRRRADRTKPG